jgi:outer membrane protein
MQANVNLSLNKLDIQDAEHLRSVAETNLKSLLSLENEQNLSPKFAVQVQPVAKISVEEALETAEKNNPGIRSALFKLDEIKANNQISIADDLPYLALTGSSGYKSPDRDHIIDDNSDFYSVGLTLTVPLFSGLSSVAKRREHHEAYYQGERSLDMIRKSVRESLDESLSDSRKLYDQLVTMQAIVKESRRALDLANAGYNRGIVSSTDIITFQNKRYDTEKRFVKNQYDYLRSVLNIRELLGTDLERVYAEAK